MDYHADRFADHSVLVFDNGNLEAMFVANEKASSIISHEGLTYGGMLLKADARLEDVLGCFFHVVGYYKGLGFTEIIYKCFPSFLASCSTQEDLYAMFLLKATLVRRDSSCVITRQHALPYPPNKKYAITRAQKQDYKVRRTDDPTGFWNDILIPNLQERFGVKPVHSVEEIKLLMSRFPDNIHLYEIVSSSALAGSVIFETPTAIHAQYIATTPAGKDADALDLLFHILITEKFANKEYISLGISNEKEGTVLNKGLMSWKEDFGGRTMTMDFYRVDTSMHTALASYG